MRRRRPPARPLPRLVRHEQKAQRTRTPPLSACIPPCRSTIQLDHIDRQAYIYHSHSLHNIGKQASNYDMMEVFLFILLLDIGDGTRKFRHSRGKTTANPYTKKICMKMENTLRARHKSCFLRPDTGPCRADILQWYYDVKQKTCYRFFWGGCQGNGNRFETRQECVDYCNLNSTVPQVKIPHFCQLSFDYGTCFGYYNRWSWDTLSKTCKHRIYSGCGGNQNNFETRRECFNTCVNPPNSTLNRISEYTTCVPYNIVDML